MLALFTILGTTLTLLQCFDKWGWLERYEYYRKRWMPEAGCWLCLSFWVSIPVSIIYFLLDGYEFVFIPFAVAGIINILVILQKK